MIFFGVFVISTLLVGFINVGFGTFDELYNYQWGLDGLSNFTVGNMTISRNHDFLKYELFQLMLENKDGKNIVKDEGSLGYDYEDPSANISFTNARKLFDKIENKKEVIVAVIDTGIDYNHVDLRDSMWINKSEIKDNGIDDDHNGYVDDYYGYNFCDNNSSTYSSVTADLHGTHTAGIIVAKHGNGGIKGIAYDPHIKIMSLKVLNEGLYGKVPAFIEAIKYAEKNGAEICNISLGNFSDNQELATTIRDSRMLFVTASGNGVNYQGYNIDENPVYPASLGYDNVISVANLDMNGNLHQSSNFGTTVDVAAPGTFILSTLPGDKYGFLTGTSVSTPMVTAVAAMIKSACPFLENNVIKNLIINSCDKRNSLTGKVKSDGSIDAYRAIDMATTIRR